MGCCSSSDENSVPLLEDAAVDIQFCGG